MKRWVFAIAAAWVFLLLTLWVFEFALMTDEKRVLRRIEEMRLAAETGKLLKLGDYIAGDYHDDYGLDRRGLIGAVGSLRREYPDLELRVEKAAVKVHGDHAEADVRGRAVQRMELIERGDFRMTFRKLDKEWKLQGLHKKETQQ
jgi:hypothetical protein